MQSSPRRSVFLSSLQGKLFFFIPCLELESPACSAGQSHLNNESPATVLDAIVQIVNPTGMLGIPGLYVPADPGGVDPHAKEGRLLIPFGKLFEKGLRLGTGQCNVKRYNRYLRA